MWWQSRIYNNLHTQAQISSNMQDFDRIVSARPKLSNISSVLD
jgi:hypothetical protein